MKTKTTRILQKLPTVGKVEAELFDDIRMIQALRSARFPDHEPDAAGFKRAKDALDRYLGTLMHSCHERQERVFSTLLQTFLLEAGIDYPRGVFSFTPIKIRRAKKRTAARVLAAAALKFDGMRPARIADALLWPSNHTDRLEQQVRLKLVSEMIESGTRYLFGPIELEHLLKDRELMRLWRLFLKHETNQDDLTKNSLEDTPIGRFIEEHPDLDLSEAFKLFFAQLNKRTASQRRKIKSSSR